MAKNIGSREKAAFPSSPFLFGVVKVVAAIGKKAQFNAQLDKLVMSTKTAWMCSELAQKFLRMDLPFLERIFYNFWLNFCF